MYFLRVSVCRQIVFVCLFMTSCIDMVYVCFERRLCILYLTCSHVNIFKVCMFVLVLCTLCVTVSAVLISFFYLFETSFTSSTVHFIAWPVAYRLLSSATDLG